jgi:hypothetical protein
MGITDEAYAQALTKQKALIKQISSATSVLRTAPAGVKVIVEKDLQSDAMKAPLSALVDMWLVRFAGEWVNEQEFAKDDFWRLALIRLMGANKLEKHQLANQYYNVYRIIE